MLATVGLVWGGGGSGKWKGGGLGKPGADSLSSTFLFFFNSLEPGLSQQAC